VSVIRRRSFGPGTAQDAAVRIVKDGVIGTADRSTTTAYTGVDVAEAHGGPADLWGESWTPANVNSTGFGIAFAAMMDSGNSATIGIDALTVSVAYDVPTGPSLTVTPTSTSTLTPVFSPTGTASPSSTTTASPTATRTQTATALPVSTTLTCVNDRSIGTVAWSTPGNAVAKDSANALVSLTGQTSNYLRCTGFTLNVPAHATITGITVSADRRRSNGVGIAQDAAVRLVKGGVTGSVDRSTATPYTGVDVREDHGGPTDLWGESWTPTDLNSPGFGVAFATRMSSGASATVGIDAITVTVSYY
jgi:hypothetical protein